MIIVDARVLIAHLDEGDALHEQAGGALERVAAHALGCSSLTLAEVFVGPAREGRLDRARAAVDALEVREIPLASDAAAHLALLRARTGLKLPDCCVLLAAQAPEAKGLLTFDRVLAREAGRLGLPAV